MSARLVLGVRREGDVVRLTSPSVGYFTGAVASGRTLSAGEVAGTLITLGRATQLVVPDDVAGVVKSNAPERVHAPVAFGSVLYEFGALDSQPAKHSKRAAADATTASGALVFRAPQTGRFWLRTAPAEPALVAVGQVIESGAALGLIEVMKTFTILQYAATSTLPARARVVRILARDGAEVAERDALLELEPA
jgi:biotin carboxyl carrier protein